MTTSTGAIDQVGEGSLAASSAVPPDPELRAIDESPPWPVTKLVAWSLMVALAASILVPATLAFRRGVDWPLLIVPAIAATVGARALFDALAFSFHSGRILRQALAVLAPALLAAAVMVGSSAIIQGRPHPVSDGVVALLTVVTLTAARVARNVEVRVRLGMRRVYFIGLDAATRDLQRELSRRHDARLVDHTSASLAHDTAKLVDRVLAARATVVVLDSEAMRVPALVESASRLNLAGVRIRDLVSYYESEFKKVPLTELNPAWFLFDIASIHRRAYRVARRAFEILFAALLLAASLPILALAMIAIMLTSGGPVLYRQHRVGRGDVPFMLVKLRTMIPATGSACEWASSQEDRLTRVGRTLRRFRIDELPQLWNVIRGELALIGPRPEQVPIAKRLEQELVHYRFRHCIRPGITGWAQVNLGYAGSAEGTVAKLQRDLYYVKHSNLRLDGLILWLTLKAVIAGRG
jgi:lipopolysaccharide/colanic/teichoic acid biosynthesis glycosyltransferase